jgi:mRNA-degrading endonuclease RelE of RelBE toxin-antitoxin system
VYKLRIPNDIAVLLRSLHPDIKKKTKAALRILAENPYEGKTLREDLEGLISYKIGRFRIVYRISARKRIEVVTIGPRKSIYEETLRILKREKKHSRS